MPSGVRGFRQPLLFRLLESSVIGIMVRRTIGRRTRDMETWEVVGGSIPGRNTATSVAKGGHWGQVPPRMEMPKFF